MGQFLTNKYGKCAEEMHEALFHGVIPIVIRGRKAESICREGMACYECVKYLSRESQGNHAEITRQKQGSYVETRKLCRNREVMSCEEMTHRSN